MKLLGQGRTAEIFEYDDNKILKLFFEGKPKSDALKEYENLQIVNKRHIPSPKVYETIEVQRRFGIVEERISGKNGFEILFQNDDSTDFIKNMVKIQNQLNSATISNDNTCISYKNSLKASLWSVKDEVEKNRIIKKIETLPDGTNLCHGDFHPGNLIVQNDGNLIIIDFVNLCYGPKLFDVARTYFLLSQGELPDELNEQERYIFEQKRMKIATLYLDFMKCTKNELSNFLDIISEVRKYEFN